MFMGSEKMKKILEAMSEEGDGESEDGSSARDGPKYGVVDENKMLEILNRMNRVVTILKVHMRFTYLLDV